MNSFAIWFLLWESVRLDNVYSLSKSSGKNTKKFQLWYLTNFLKKRKKFSKNLQLYFFDHSKFSKFHLTNILVFFLSDLTNLKFPAKQVLNFFIQIKFEFVTGGFSSANESPFGFYAQDCRVQNSNDSSQFVSMITNQLVRYGGRCVLADYIFPFLFGFSLGNYFNSFEMSHFQLLITNT